MEPSIDCQEKLQKIIKKGYENASLTFFDLLEISNSGKLEIDFENAANYSVNNETDFSVFKIEIIGELTGIAYFFFTKEQVDKIATKGIRKEVFQKGVNDGDLLTQGFMVEVANMLSAPILTELVVSSGIDVYGSVPKLYYGNASFLKKTMDDELSMSSMKQLFNTRLHDDEMGLDIVSIWFFSATSIDRLIKVTE